MAGQPESLKDLLRIAKEGSSKWTKSQRKRTESMVGAGTFSSRYDPFKVGTFMAPVSDSPSGHGSVSKAHLAMGRKACPICFEQHSLAAHKSHGVTSFARTHGGQTRHPATKAALKEGAKKRKAKPKATKKELKSPKKRS